MKLQQLRYLVQVAKQGLSVSDAALALHTSQPGISKQIRLLEQELGVEIFVRHGKRVIEITPPGKTIIAIAERVLREAENIRQAGREFSAETAGSLTIATTHTQARYVLPPVIKNFMARYPDVRLSLKQGSPVQISETVVDGEADLVIATEAITHFEALVMLPCYQGTVASSFRLPIPCSSWSDLPWKRSRNIPSSPTTLHSQVARPCSAHSTRRD